MTPPSPPQPSPRKRSRWWWISIGLAAVVVSLGYVVFYFLAEPIIGTASIMLGRPHMPGCTARPPSEGTTGSLWYRISELRCESGLSIHYVFVASSGYSWRSLISAPAFMSIDHPVPTGVQQTDDKSFEIVLAAPAADGRDRLPVIFGRYGIPAEIHIFDRGKRRDF